MPCVSEETLQLSGVKIQLLEISVSLHNRHEVDFAESRSEGMGIRVDVQNCF